jgi:hypothetical protein
MNSERWRQAKEICYAVLDREPDQRSTMLAELCQGDAELRREVVTMLIDVLTDDSAYASPPKPNPFTPR